MSKQAVLLIHGIGEQRPMDTLRGFVRAVWNTNTPAQRDHGSNRDGMWSKPYFLSENFELRLLTTAENRNGIRTDFFELYWAHLMHGTKAGHVVAWARTLLVRWPWTVPPQLRLAYWVLLGLVVTTCFLAISGAFKDVGSDTPWVRYAISLLILPLGTWLLTAIVGDAARYLHVAPPNVQTRNEIRAAAVAVLKALHERKYGYERIVVVGHSLGTVIGYDMLTHAWPQLNRAPEGTPGAGSTALDNLESLARDLTDGKVVPAADFQAAQRRYFNELHAGRVPWLVTDFITLGSPLAHAALLLAPNGQELETRIRDREFPSCPPALEAQQKDHQQIRGFSYPAGEARRVPHHAAVFAPTRWTNLYFPCRLLVWGDLVGGPLAGLFGAGVHDVQVATRRWLGFLSHTAYWTLHGKNNHVQSLRDALDITDERNQ